MFHLAPVGLESVHKKVTRERHLPLQNQVLGLIQKLKQGRRDAVYTSKDQTAIELIKSLDAFFCHGLIVEDKCYWRYVREFLPMSIQQSLKLEWDVNTERSLSIAWLKNALNQQTLHFQMLAFVGQPKVAIKFYDKNACVRNIPVLKRLAVGAGDLGEIQFRFENNSQCRQYDIPVAQLSSQTPIVHVPSSSAIETRSFIKSRTVQSGSNEIILSASFQHANEEFLQRFPPANRSMVRLARDLPRVEVPQTAHEPFLSNARDQDYMINEIVKTHRFRAQSRSNLSSSSSSEANNDTKTEEKSPTITEEVQPKSTANPENRMRKRSPLVEHPVGSLRQKRGIDLDAVSTSSSFSTTSTDDEIGRYNQRTPNTQTGPVNIELNRIEQPVVSLHEELNNTTTTTNTENLLNCSSSVSPASAPESTNLDQLLTENVDGDIALSSGEIIQMALSVFEKDVENFQRLFSVYIDHAVGEPKRRFLLLTDHYIYLLTTQPVTAGEVAQLSRSVELSYLSSTPAMDSLEESDDSGQAPDSMQLNYQTEIKVQLEEIDYLTMGVDGQSVQFHTKTHKFKTATSEHEYKHFMVETASERLGQCIVTSVQCIIRKFTKKRTQVQVFSGMTLYSIILKNFVRRELSLNSVNLRHGSLVYWLQHPAENKHSPKPLEGYLFTRSFNPSAWRRKTDRWVQKYFMLDRSKLYQFTDSTCRGAEFQLNIKERVEEVVELELKADEKFVLELRLNDDSPNIQLSFQTLTEMHQWMRNISMTLSTAIQGDIRPVACAMILTDTATLFIQEGANCQVDGFMRLLLQITFRDIAALASLNTFRHHLLILRRESGDSEVIFLRNESELQRVCASFGTHWQLNIEELSETTAQADPAYSKIYTQCCQLADVWSSSEERVANDRIF